MTAVRERDTTRPRTCTSGRRPPPTGTVATYAALVALSPLPQTFDPHNYTDASSRFDFTVYLRNSTLVTVGATVLTPVINAMAVYALAKYTFRGRNVLFLVTLGTIMIPQIIFIPLQQVAAPRDDELAAGHDHPAGRHPDRRLPAPPVHADAPGRPHRGGSHRRGR
jgi:hypothetical protein